MAQDKHNIHPIPSLSWQLVEEVGGKWSHLLKGILPGPKLERQPPPSSGSTADPQKDTHSSATVCCFHMNPEQLMPRCNFSPIAVKICKYLINFCWQGFEKSDSHVTEGVERGTRLWKKMRQYLTKLHMHICFAPLIPLLGTYQKFFLFFFLFLLFFFFFFGHAHSMHKFLGKGLNPNHRSNQSHSNDNAGSLTCWATRELLKLILYTYKSVVIKGAHCSLACESKRLETT